LKKTPRAMEVPASEVKNSWHEYIDLVSKGRQEVTVTRYGRPIIRMVPIEDESPPKLFGRMKGTVTILGDIINPIEDVVWEADLDSGPDDE
jgi:prevent-host-death family protein